MKTTMNHRDAAAPASCEKQKKCLGYQQLAAPCRTGACPAHCLSGTSGPACSGYSCAHLVPPVPRRVSLAWQPALELVPMVLMQVHVLERVQVQVQAPESAQIRSFPVGTWSEREPPVESRPRRDRPRCV